MKANANIDLFDFEGASALHNSCFIGNHACLDLLLNKLSVEQQQQLSLVINSGDHSGTTAVHQSVIVGSLDCLVLLTKAGAKVNLVDKESCTPLHYAAFFGHSDCLDHLIKTTIHLHHPDLLKEGETCKSIVLPNPDIILPLDKQKASPLHKAAFKGSLDCISILIEYGVDVNHLDANGDSPLHCASFQNHDKCIRLLCEKGAHIDQQNNDLESALHKAAFFGHDESIDVLLKHNANPLIGDSHKSTALHNAVLQGHVGCIDKLLMQETANVPDIKQNTPLHIAAIYSKLAALQFLLNKEGVGMNIDTENIANETALYIAVVNGFEDIARDLVLEGANIHHEKILSILKNEHVSSSSSSSSVSSSPLSENGSPSLSLINTLQSTSPRPQGQQTPTLNQQLPLAQQLPLDQKGTGENHSKISLSLLESFVAERERRKKMKDSTDPVRKNKLRCAIAIFNDKPTKGLKQLQEEGLLGTSNQEVAEFLHTQERLSKQAIGELLGEVQFIDLLKSFVDYLNFTGLSFEAALRHFLSTFRLPGEAQKIDRMMESFAQKFYQTSKDAVFASSDAAYILAFSVIMLNTDAHNPAIKKQYKMTKAQFISNNRGINEGDDIPREYLEHIYDRIIQEQIKMDVVENVFSNAEKKGYLTKQGGRVKTWKKRWFALTNNNLYYFKSSEEENTPCGWIPLENLQITPIQSTKKYTMMIQPAIAGQNIKSCKMVDGKPVPGSHGRFIISASSEEELNSWMDTIKRSMQMNPLFQIVQNRKKK